MIKVITKIVLIAALTIPAAFIYSESLTIKEIPGMHPVSLDLPPDWKKETTTRSNGVIITLKNGNSQIEVRNFTLPNFNMEYIINAKAARLFAEYGYVSLLLEKSRDIGDITEKTLFWKMVSMSKPYLEKTVIQKYNDNIIVLSCKAPENEYQHHRVIFENAVLSLVMNLEETVEAPEEKKVTTEDIIESLTDERVEKGDKSDKLLEPEEVK